MSSPDFAGDPPGLAPSGRPLDPDVLQRLRKELGENDDSLGQVLSAYLTELGSLRNDILRSSEAWEVDPVKYAAHRLGSASVMVGATRLARLCKELELLEGVFSDERIDGLVASIEAESDAVHHAVATLLALGASSQTR
jgi:HPt (histidine-containing phosphotransfer) domain-containing protein